MSTTICPVVGASETLAAGIHPRVPFGRIGMLIRYQTSPSLPSCLRTARIACGRKSGRKSCITLMIGECGFGVLRTATEWTLSWPAAGKTLSIVVRDETDLEPVEVVEVCVVPVAPATARVG